MKALSDCINSIFCVTGAKLLSLIPYSLFIRVQILFTIMFLSKNLTRSIVKQGKSLNPDEFAAGYIVEKVKEAVELLFQA